MSRCKVFALYLPQFHQTHENDVWWGKGFTEWTSVKKALKLVNVSRQPRIPLEGYYDLSQEDSIRHQADIAKKFHVDGFCIYHYYSNGKLLLNKPAEILLRSDIDICFFFSWANHDWRRTWYGYNKEVLLKQEYGNEKQIRDHYNYLKPFFADERYFKIDNKPVIAIYKASYINNLDLYQKIWTELALNDGFNGVYFLLTNDGTESQKHKECFDATFDFEPGITISDSIFKLTRFMNRIRSNLIKRKIIKKSVAQLYDFKKVAKSSAKRFYNNENNFYGVFTGWDNTPRHGVMGTVYYNDSIESFKEYFKLQYQKSLKSNCKLLMVNAWNEWSEGAYLEPDADRGYSLLQSISDVVEELEGYNG